MNSEHWRSRLHDLETRLVARIGREKQHGLEQFVDVPSDMADLSVADERAAETFAEAEINSVTLSEVREAIGRIDAGTFGTCVSDGAPIPAARLEAVPWTRYCAVHQAELEANSPKMPTM